LKFFFDNATPPRVVAAPTRFMVANRRFRLDAGHERDRFAQLGSGISKVHARPKAGWRSAGCERKI
jgi:hypothetical protein